MEDENKNQAKGQMLSAIILKALKNPLNLEELVCTYSATIMLLLLDREMQSKRLEILSESFNYSDMLKPTMIHYATRELLETFKHLASLKEEEPEDFDYMLYLLAYMPHIIIASETGKFISLSLLRSFIADLTRSPPIVMHIYRSISEVYQMIKAMDMTEILGEWSLLKIYIFVRSFSLILTTAALNTNNAALKQAGYRGFELPQGETELEMSNWFKTLRNRLGEKHKNDSSRQSAELLRFIDFNILNFLSESGTEVTSEAGNEPSA
ncbi:uncharacterized protein LOC108602042 [Drosophila busckii]|uniref:uncharacterized protein LOC108602042 n=1 Tax=Drosophila busckii TaxID=30019 RepID=UPI00083EF51D|nr:uncharacterized protein LOC108602042 [Drosophila busckii]